MSAADALGLYLRKRPVAKNLQWLSAAMAGLELPKMSPEELKEMRAAFDIMDENKDGEITVKELSDLIKSYGMFASDEEIKVRACYVVLLMISHFSS